MSHYIYRKKKFLDLGDGNILPLVLYSDSSVTSTKYDKYDRKHIYHPKHWAVGHTFGHGIIIDKKIFDFEVIKMYEDEMQKLEEFNAKYENGEVPTKESYSYYGTKYPGGGKMKHMKSFYSTKHLFNATEFFNRYSFRIVLSAYDTETYIDVEKLNFDINIVEDLYEAQNGYHTLKEKYPECGLCIGIYGLEGVE